MMRLQILVDLKRCMLRMHKHILYHIPRSNKREAIRKSTLLVIPRLLLIHLVTYQYYLCSADDSNDGDSDDDSDEPYVQQKLHIT